MQSQAAALRATFDEDIASCGTFLFVLLQRNTKATPAYRFYIFWLSPKFHQTPPTAPHPLPHAHLTQPVFPNSTCAHPSKQRKKIDCFCILFRSLRGVIFFLQHIIVEISSGCASRCSEPSETPLPRLNSHAAGDARSTSRCLQPDCALPAQEQNS